jgi:SAM-dependent methyltransferase
MEVLQQIESGIIVTPRSKKRLLLSGDKSCLVTEDALESYPLYQGGIPILLEDPSEADEYICSSENIKTEYSYEYLKKRSKKLARIKERLLAGYRNEKSDAAFNAVFASQGETSVCLSVGGGPGRSHPQLTNLNIGPFPNVDIVADAHCLPYANESVDVVYCEAVLEHLHSPVTAIREMHRVLKRGGLLFSGTPFLQQYHGYPYHFQNFTLTGHEHLYRSCSFAILESGVRFGPFYTLVDLTFSGLRNYVPFPLRWPLTKLFNVMAIFLLIFDKFVYDKDNSYVLASSTYVVAQK